MLSRKKATAPYAFLKHDSYLNCAEVIECFTESDIIDQLLADLARIKGVLNEGTKEAILKAVRKAKTISALTSDR